MSAVDCAPDVVIILCPYQLTLVKVQRRPVSNFHSADHATCFAAFVPCRLGSGQCCNFLERRNASDGAVGGNNMRRLSSAQKGYLTFRCFLDGSLNQIT